MYSLEVCNDAFLQIPRLGVHTVRVSPRFIIAIIICFIPIRSEQRTATRKEGADPTPEPARLIPVRWFDHLVLGDRGAIGAGCCAPPTG
jgi:hypothetical protein